jgi:hypothetical protein
MTREQLAAATKAYDREDLDMDGQTPTPGMQAAHDRVMNRGRGRPVKGEGAAPVQITIERGLLKQVDDYAQAKGMSRSELIAVVLRKEIKRKRSA